MTHQLNTEKITGFSKVESSKTDGRGHFLLAYCFRTGKKLSLWFTQQGEFNTCLAVYNSIHETDEYYYEITGKESEIFTLLFELNEEETQAIRLIDHITVICEKNTKEYRDLFSIDKGLKPFNIDDYLE